MNTSFLSLALGAALAAGQGSAPSWQATYSQAQQQGAAQNKPLAIVFGSGPNAWANIVRDGAPSADVTRSLTDGYVCLYVDTTTPTGKQLAQQFAINTTGLVLSNRSGSLQAFWHQGDLTNESLARHLRKYADPQLVVHGTETANTSRTSFYPADSAEGAWGTSGSTYCPNCNNARFRR